MPITESGITLNFPDNNYFRFEDCQGYKEIQSMVWQQRMFIVWGLALWGLEGSDNGYGQIPAYPIYWYYISSFIQEYTFGIFIQ